MNKIVREDNMDIPILYDYFKSKVELLKQQYEIQKVLKASDNIGKNRELFIREFLEGSLPKRLSIEEGGEIWDSKGKKTGQQDIIIYRDDIPKITTGEVNVYLVEGVFSVIEVKSNLTRGKLQESIKALKTVKELSSLPALQISSSRKKGLSRCLRCVFAYEGATWKTIMNELSKSENESIIDIVSILNRGILISEEIKIIRSVITDPRYGIIRSKEHPLSQFGIIKFPSYATGGTEIASLGMLYYILSQYSIEFLWRTIELAPYFEPIQFW
ncbi:MAG: DUF6602 domain-containing protein [Candidatus Hodarchaeales archaeon]|jgi:hypothetical protein